MKLTTLATLFCSQAVAIHVTNEQHVPLTEAELLQMEQEERAEVYTGLNERTSENLSQEQSSQSNLVEADEDPTDPLSEGYWHKFLMLPEKYSDIEYKDTRYTCGMTKSTYTNSDTGEYFMYLI